MNPFRSAWLEASRLGSRTPAERNRYVDFLRAASILAVVLGHWLMAAPWMHDGSPRLDHMLDLAPWTRGLTWLLQVMPAFFLVGGYSNAASWRSARRRGDAYADWLSARLRRLIAPMLPLLACWIVLAVVFNGIGVKVETVRIASQVALVPMWFLAVYLLVVALVPLTLRFHERAGLASFWALAVGAVAIDLAAFRGGLQMLRWLNYGFIWVAVHQLGFAWRDGRLPWPRALAWSCGGLAGALGLVFGAGYPVSMVGVPGEAVSNTLPPTVALLAFAVFQCGALLALEGPARRLLDRAVLWTGTVLVNANIMTLYLWHSTVLVLWIGLLVKLGGPGLSLVPATATWWWARIPWILALALVLLPCMALFGRFERPEALPSAPPVWRSLLGGSLLVLGIGLLSLDGIAAAAPLGLRPVAFLPLAGAIVARVSVRRPA